VKIVAMGDIHCRLDTKDLIANLIGELDHSFDVMVLAGDLTDSGLPEEAEVLAEQLKTYSIPIITILGNHDHEGGKPKEITQVMRDAGYIVLDGTVHEVGNVGFVGTKGFCGGFDECLVQPFGEAALKTFIRTSIDEALNLENALAQLEHCEHKVAVLHYSPIKSTLIGEPPELFPFLGTSRLATAIDSRGADLILHGHAHHGSPFGRTAGNIPVYNVSRFVQVEHSGKPYCVIEFAQSENETDPTCAAT
jgi:uncharacterized protein